MLMLQDFIGGLDLVLKANALTALLIGTVIGYIVGAIPGLTSSIALAVIIPFTFHMSPVPAIVLMVSIYMASEYAGAIPAILANAPGTPAAAPTAFDGYPMRLKGEAGKALTLSILGSGFGALIGTLLLVFTAVSIVKIAIIFGPPEYFSLAVLGLSLVGVLSSSFVLKGFIGLLFGLLLATIGLDPISGNARFAITDDFLSGIPLLPALIGLFALSEVFFMLETIHHKVPEMKEIPRLSMSFGLFRGMKIHLLRSAVIGYVIGVVPGAGATIAAMTSYAEAKRASKDPETYGTGNPRGVVASETANNAAVAGAMAPLLTLGIPGSASTAIMIGGLLIQGIQPGPMLFVDRPTFPYSIFAAMLLGLPVMVALGLFGVRLWVKVTLIPVGALATAITAICILGAYTNENGMYPVWVMVGLGVAGYLMRKVDIHPAPIVLALVLATMMETNFRRALMGTGGDPRIFVTSPISACMLVLAILVVVVPALHNFKRRRASFSKASARTDP
jgi:putative tricarboxylic transport membrane protein